MTTVWRATRKVRECRGQQTVSSNSPWGRWRLPFRCGRQAITAGWMATATSVCWTKRRWCCPTCTPPRRRRHHHRSCPRCRHPWHRLPLRLHLSTLLSRQHRRLSRRGRSRHPRRALRHRLHRHPRCLRLPTHHHPKARCFLASTAVSFRWQGWSVLGAWG